MSRAAFRLLVPCLLLVAAGAGCRRSGIRTYLAPREAGAPVAAGLPEKNTDEPPRPASPRPRMAYSTPAGWSPAENGQFAVLSFAIATREGAATCNVTPLGNFAGREAQLVNMWRTQVGAPELSAEEAAKALSAVEVAGAQGQLFEVAGAREGKTNRIVTAMLSRPESTWFFKLAGDEAAVNAQRPAFLAFLKSFRFEEAAAAGDPAAPVPAAAAP